MGLQNQLAEKESRPLTARDSTRFNVFERLRQKKLAQNLDRFLEMPAVEKKLRMFPIFDISGKVGFPWYSVVKKQPKEGIS